MIEAAKHCTVFNALCRIRLAYKIQLQSLPGPKIELSNVVDEETPSLAFRWIDDWAYGKGVEKPDNGTLLGCTKCRPDMGQNIGCEYTRKCDCLEFAAPDLARCNSEETEIFNRWKSGEGVDTTGLPKRFPYHSTGPNTGCLVNFYLESRNVIYECNSSCGCGRNCKNRNVQHGRKVELQIFKTASRGFGLKCLSDLKKGQFIDRYLGELITDKTADEREAAAGPGRASYLFSLDKHAGDEIAEEDCYVADSEAMGGPSKFINHSCDPNCRLFTVSYNKNEYRVYDLAFFALEAIPAGTELTFDYKDADDPGDKEVGDSQREEREKRDQVLGKKKVPCLCGAEKCRGVMWE